MGLVGVEAIEQRFHHHASPSATAARAARKINTQRILRRPHWWSCVGYLPRPDITHGTSETPISPGILTSPCKFCRPSALPINASTWPVLRARSLVAHGRYLHQPARSPRRRAFVSDPSDRCIRRWACRGARLVPRRPSLVAGTTPLLLTLRFGQK